jgi:endonuclease YncB( thermonuclease family)
MPRVYRPRWLALQACAVAALLLSSASMAAPSVVEGRVVGVSDGDTMTVLEDGKTQHTVRIAGIYAPEKGQAFGEQSKQSLSALVFQKRVEARCHKKDRYGREVCGVFVSLRDVGLEPLSSARSAISYAARESRPAQLEPGTQEVMFLMPLVESRVA